MSDTLTLPAADESTGVLDPTSLVGSTLGALCVRILVLALGVISVSTAAGRINIINASGEPWVAWDGQHYLDIIQNGYASTLNAPHYYTIAFFPVYPFACRLMTALVSPTLAMVLVSNICALIGFIYLYKWSKLLVGSRVAMLCVLVTATYPGAVFFSAGMTEGPFLLLVSLTLYFLQRDKFWFAAIVAGISTATRPTGVALAIIVPLYAFTRTPSLPFWKRAAMFIALGLLSSSGGIIYDLFLWHRYGTLRAYFIAQEYWADGDAKMMRQQQAQGIVRYSLKFFRDRAMEPQAWNRLVALGVLVVTVVGFFKPAKLSRLFFLLPLIIFLMTYLPNNGLRASSILRYESCSAPLFLLVAIWLSERDRRPVLLAVLGTMLAMQAYYAVLFSRGVWIG